MHQAWLCLTAVSVFLVPHDFRPSRGWLAAYIVPAAVIVPVAVVSAADSGRRLRDGFYETQAPEWLQQLQLLNVGTLLHVGLIVGMVVSLIRAPRWLFPLAVFGGAVAAVQLLGYDYGNDGIYGWWLKGTWPWIGMNVVQLILAVACAGHP